MKPSEILTRAADLIEPEGKWTQGHFARNARHQRVDYCSPAATCFCMVGAISRLGPDLQTEMKVWSYLTSVTGVHDFPAWNDCSIRTQSEVVSALRAAAELSKQQEAQ